MTAIAAVFAVPRFASANPTGGVVVDGAATISSAGSVTNVAQSTNSAIINWQNFSIASGETVNFLAVETLKRDVEGMTRVVGQLLDAAEVEAVVIDPTSRPICDRSALKSQNSLRQLRWRRKKPSRRAAQKGRSGSKPTRKCCVWPFVIWSRTHSITRQGERMPRSLSE